MEAEIMTRGSNVMTLDFRGGESVFRPWAFRGDLVVAEEAGLATDLRRGQTLFNLIKLELVCTRFRLNGTSCGKCNTWTFSWLHPQPCTTCTASETRMDLS
jgi:hypothetical protein